MVDLTRTYYQIRFTGPCQYWKAGDLYQSNSGTSQWSELSKVKALLTRGIPTGYKGRTLIPFVNHEVIRVDEVISQTETVIIP